MHFKFVSVRISKIQGTPFTGVLFPLMHIRVDQALYKLIEGFLADGKGYVGEIGLSHTLSSDKQNHKDPVDKYAPLSRRTWPFRPSTSR